MAGLSGQLRALGVARRADISGRSLSRLKAAYRLHVGRVYTLCLRLLADAKGAEEATARVFARLSRELPRRPDEERLRDITIEEGPAKLGTAGRGAGTTAAAATTTAAVAPSQGSLDALAARLPDGRRVAFVLRDVEGLSVAAVARHMLTDVAGLGMALLAARFAEKEATPEHTYGFYRVEILAELTNAVVLIGISLSVLYEAYERFRNPPEV